MRELKFRIWDLQRKLFTSDQNTCCDLSLDLNGNVGCHDSYYGIRAENFITQQFTGLKDKNSQDIYEGDILFRESAGYKYIVFWDTPEGSWKLKDSDGDCSIYLGDFSMKNLEIIGNIFENK